MCLFCTCIISLVTFPMMFANCFDSPDGRARAKCLKLKNVGRKDDLFSLSFINLAAAVICSHDHHCRVLVIQNN